MQRCSIVGWVGFDDAPGMSGMEERLSAIWRQMKWLEATECVFEVGVSGHFGLMCLEIRPAAPVLMLCGGSKHPESIGDRGVFCSLFSC